MRIVIAKAKQTAATLAEIQGAERARAATLMQNPAFQEWIEALRERYIVKGFLKPLYTIGGRYSIANLRITKFGKYILPWEKQGEVFQENPRVWIRAENTWFWIYLSGGQEAVPMDIQIPELPKNRGIPAKLIWQETISITEKLKLNGEDGGGILTSQGLNVDYLVAEGAATGGVEDKPREGNLKNYQLPPVPPWMTWFDQYNQGKFLHFNVEIRPAWYHLLKYTFYNIPIPRLPVFFMALNDRLHVDKISFLEANLSAAAREYLGGEFLQGSSKLWKQITSSSFKKDFQEMVWWLWHNVAYPGSKRGLTFSQIASKSKTPPSSIKTAVSRFDRKLYQETEGIILGKLLRVADTLGLDLNQVLTILDQQGLVPARKREIDGFDTLDDLIRNLKSGRKTNH